MAVTAHATVNIGNIGHTDSMNGKAFHTHIPRIYGRQDTTFNNTMIDGGGCVECGICGEVLMDSAA
jgi:hypothetical protein